MNLPEIFTQKTVIEVDAFDLNDFIKDQYGLDEFEGTLESPNDSTHSFSVNAEPASEWDVKDLIKIIENKSCEHYSLGRVLDDLCRKNVIPSGEYLVSVCW